MPTERRTGRSGASSTLGKTYTTLPPPENKTVTEACDEASDGSSRDACGSCKRKVLDDQSALCCELCEEWYHIGCQKVPADRYKLMQRMEEFTWFCSGCGGKFKNLKEENKKLREELKTLLKENEDMKNRMKTVERKVETMEHGDDIVETVKHKVLEALKEQEDKKVRQNNLILYQVPESNRPSGKEREEDDTKLCKEIFESKLGCKCEIKKVVRLGRGMTDLNNNSNSNRNSPNQDSRPRLLLVKLENRSEKYEILTQAKKLSRDNDETYRRIFIGPDQTPAEREESRKLREELRRRRDCGEAGWYIKGGKLMRSAEEGRQGENFH